MQLGDYAALLGADLLTGPAGCGWEAVLASFQPGRLAEVFKVPHHGSHTAQHDRVWSDLLAPEPIAILAPYRARYVVPNAGEIDYLLSKSPNVYASADPRLPAAPAAVRRTAAELSQVASNVRDPWGSVGHVRVRRRAGGEWTVRMAGPATSLAAS